MQTHVALAVLALAVSATAQDSAAVAGPVCDAPPATSAPPIELELAATGLDSPVGVTHAGDGSNRLFVTEQFGTIRIIADGQTLEEPFLDVSDLIASEDWEQGLLGLAFHPAYEENGRFFIFYTAAEDDSSVLAEYAVSPDHPDRALPAGRLILTISGKQELHHNAGQLQFGPDGFLYVAIGDGGWSGEGQRRESMLGTIARIDVDTADDAPYAVPDDNPFVDEPDAPPETWAYGFRNPWRFSFDACTGDLFAGDVGGGQVEEIDLVTRGGNYGWSIFEGSRCNDANGCDALIAAGAQAPIFDYQHLQLDPEGGNAVVGGYVYRGAEFPRLNGVYLFGDFASQRIWGLTRGEAGDWSAQELLVTGFPISAFGVGEDGSLYVANRNQGELHRIVQRP